MAGIGDNDCILKRYFKEIDYIEGAGNLIDLGNTYH